MTIIDWRIILIRYQRQLALYFLQLKYWAPECLKKEPDILSQFLRRFSKRLNRILCPMFNTTIISVIYLMYLVRYLV